MYLLATSPEAELYLKKHYRRGINKKLQRYIDEGLVVTVTDEFFNLWTERRAVAGVPYYGQANLNKPRHYNVVRIIGRAQELIAEEDKLNGDDADVEDYIEKVKREMDKSLAPVVDEYTALQAEKDFKRTADSEVRRIATQSDQALHDEAKRRFLEES